MNQPSCARCTGQCCWQALIRLSGDDVRRIARAQRLPYDAFVEARVADRRRGADDPLHVTFVLGGEGTPRQLVLRHHRWIPGACTFLVQLPGSHQPCGVYADRPTVCRVYPMTSETGAIAVRDDVICKPDFWENGIDPVPWRAALDRQAIEWRRYAEIVAAWNANRPGGLDDFYRFIDAAYDRLGDLG